MSNWTPIGTHTTPFKGSYDGNGKTISNLTINAPTENYKGLFSEIDSNGEVKNIGLINCNISGKEHIGGVAGYNFGTVQNCYVTGSVFGTDAHIGGVIGINGGTVQYCYATATVFGGTGSYSIGGIVGLNSNTVKNCYTTGNVSADSSMAGGVAGANAGTMQYCYATGNVSAGSSMAGGVIGWLFDSEGIVQNCVALNQNISASDTTIGRVVGEVNTDPAYGGPPTLTNNYGRSDGQKNGGSASWANIGLNNRDGANITSANWGNKSWWTTTARWDFTNVWEWGSNNLPKLKGVADPGTGGVVANPDPEPGTVDNPFLVYNVATLQKVGTGTDGWSLSAHYKQTADISLPVASSGGSNWTPIYAIIYKDNGGQIVSFSGSYDGNGKTIRNLTINAPTEDNQGLFGIIGDSAVVKNVGLVNCAIVGNQGVGGLVGFSSGKVENCYISGTISGYIGVGGVVGINYYYGTNTVQNCYVTGNVSGTHTVGGVVGGNHGMVQNCYITGTGSVSGNGAIGGVVGGNLGVVENCYSTVNVFGHGGPSGHFTENGIGGVVGNCSGSISEARLTIVRNCYSTGNISGIYISGGVVGFSGEAGKAGVYATIENCYATGDVFGNSLVGGVVGEDLGPMLNCVALNRNITITETDIGRVLGMINTSSATPTLANNYGRSDMKKNSGSPAWSNIGLNDLDGADVSAGQYNNQNWWATASNWHTAGWDFTNVWQWGSSNLPILRNMPGTATQNPVVKP